LPAAVTSLNQTQLAALLQGAKTIEADGGGLKVARLANGDFLKLFRKKRWLSSALWAAPAKRFADNGKRLLALGIAAPLVIELISLCQGKSAVRYQPLAGQTLREHWAALEVEERRAEVRQFGEFLGLLHGKGVYFRSLHLGNVLRLEDGGFGLIDLSDMSISRRALSTYKRRRNLKHMLRYPADNDWLLSQHKEDWLNGYAQSAGQIMAGNLAKALEQVK